MPKIKEEILVKINQLASNKKQEMIFVFPIFINPLDVIYPIKDKKRWNCSKIKYFLLYITWASQNTIKKSSAPIGNAIDWQ